MPWVILYNKEDTLVGQAAVETVGQSMLQQDSSLFTPEQPLPVSVKQILGMTPEQLQQDKTLLDSLPFPFHQMTMTKYFFPFNH
jgi:hypothetical protein